MSGSSLAKAYFMTLTDHVLSRRANECARFAREFGRAALSLAVFIDRTCSVQRSPGNDLVAQKAALSALHSSRPCTAFFSDLPRWQTQIVGPMNLSGGAFVGEQGRAGRFSPWRIAALALSGEPLSFQRYLGSRRVLHLPEN